MRTTSSSMVWATRQRPVPAAVARFHSSECSFCFGGGVPLAQRTKLRQQRGRGPGAGNELRDSGIVGSSNPPWSHPAHRPGGEAPGVRQLVSNSHRCLAAPFT